MRGLKWMAPSVASLLLLACGERTDRMRPDTGTDDAMGDGSRLDASTSDTTGGTDAATSAREPESRYTGPQPLECDDVGNPAFGSCLDTLITSSCWSPDIEGRCVDDGSELAWASGHSRTGSPFGDSFLDSDGSSCLELDYFSTGASPDVQFLSAGTDNVTLDETADGSMRIVCSDTTTVLLTPQQAFDFFMCKGLICQCPLGSKFILPCITNDLFCEDTAGSWERCLHECGEEVTCEVPGCNCGADQTFVSAVGCQPDPSCD